MNKKDFMEVRVDITDAEIIDKLDILRLERGISTTSFIIQAIAEKLRKEGYLTHGAKDHVRKPVERKKRPMSFDMAWMMRK